MVSFEEDVSPHTYKSWILLLGAFTEGVRYTDIGNRDKIEEKGKK